MNSNFKFDKKTGTMVNNAVEVVDGTKNGRNGVGEVSEVSPETGIEKPVFGEGKQIVKKADKANVQDAQIVRMCRVENVTPIQLIDKNGFPEAYLDSASTGIVLFRERQDYSICQITDERTGKVLCYIGGYALQFDFNMQELNTMERIEQCLQGLVKLFRHKIMNQELHSKE